MEQQEALQTLNKIGIPLKYGTLLNYEKQGLITVPERGSGYGGKWAKYKLVAIAEAAVAWKLIHGKYGNDVTAEVFDGKPPSINVKAVHLARLEWLKSAKKTGIITKEYLKKLDKQDLEATRGFMNDLSGYRYLIMYMAYVYRQELFETFNQLRKLGLS